MKKKFDKIEYNIDEFRIKKFKFSLELKFLNNGVSINISKYDIKKGEDLDDFF